MYFKKTILALFLFISGLSLTVFGLSYKYITNSFYKVVNIDVTFIAENPIIKSYTSKMCEVIALSIKIEPANISIKGKSNEEMGFIGRGEGAAAIAVALLCYNKY